MENDVTTKITIWNEGRHEKLHPNIARIYPHGIHAQLQQAYRTRALQYVVATLTILTRV